MRAAVQAEMMNARAPPEALVAELAPAVDVGGRAGELVAAGLEEVAQGRAAGAAAEAQEAASTAAEGAVEEVSGA